MIQYKHGAWLLRCSRTDLLSQNTRVIEFWSSWLLSLFWLLSLNLVVR